jgi:hypothetical protein
MRRKRSRRVGVCFYPAAFKQLRACQGEPTGSLRWLFA